MGEVRWGWRLLRELGVKLLFDVDFPTFFKLKFALLSYTFVKSFYD